MKIYCFSDVHLEFRYVEPPVPSESNCILVIAGDLGNPMLPSYSKYLTECSRLYSHVILVSGNHEYYSRARTMSKTEDLIRQTCKDVGDNVHYLQCESITIEGIKFIGCTLWTDLTPVFDKCPCTNDFKMILDLDISKYQELHLRHRSWLAQELKNDKSIVITHHPPSFKCMHSKYAHLGKSNCYYYTDMDEIVAQSILWISGHTHQSTITYISDVCVVINPVGYPGEINMHNPSLHVNTDDMSIHMY